MSHFTDAALATRRGGERQKERRWRWVMVAGAVGVGRRERGKKARRVRENLRDRLMPCRHFSVSGHGLPA